VGWEDMEVRVRLGGKEVRKTWSKFQRSQRNFSWPHLCKHVLTCLLPEALGQGTCCWNSPVSEPSNF
jgi:hypothetical protein